MSIQIQIRRDDTANWESKNPILAEGEIGYDLTENKFKVGDGTSAWMELEYSGGGVDLTDIVTSVNSKKGDVVLAVDDLSDVSAASPSRDDLLVWNGTNWEANNFAFVQTALSFKGGIAPTADAPATPEAGDLYVFDADGALNASWGVLSGAPVVAGKFVGYAAGTNNRWYLLGDMADTGVMKILEGTGVNVDSSKPSEPVISITETDPTVPQHVKSISTTNISNWDAAHSWGNHASAGYQPAGSYADSNHTHSQYLTSSSLSGYATESWVTSGYQPKGSYAPTSHTHPYVPLSGNSTISGTLTCTGDVIAYSDERLKDNVETLDGSKVFEMRGVSYTKEGRASSGVIAQELQKVAPELVHDDGEYLGVAYGNLAGYLIEAVKELKAEIEDLKRG